MEDKRDLVSIIVPTYNKLEFLKPMMDSIELFTDWPFELIIVDNNSDDGTKEFVLNSNYKMSGQYIRNEINNGFAKANNQGSIIAKGNFLCFLNNDTIVTEGWLTEMMKVFSEEKACGLVGARLIHPGRGTIQHAGVIERNDGLPDHIYFNKPMNYPLAMERKDYFGVTGACIVIPKTLYEDIGGFDESYWCGWEDMEMCQQIHARGLRVIYEPKSMVYHYESRTEGRYSAEGQNFSLYMSRWILPK
jgi:GT2 family glycosyltransferase